MPASSADSAGQSAPSGLAGKTPSSHGGPTANVRHRRGVTTSNRPLWMMIPGGVLMIFVIVVPILLGLYISVLNLDQYTIRQWLSAPFVGPGNYIEAVTDSPLLKSFWISLSFAVLSTAAAVPLGIAAALATQNRFPGRAVVRSVFLIPFVMPSFVVATVWRTMFQPDGVIVNGLHSVGITSGLWLNGPNSYWTLVIVEIWASWPFIYLLALAGLQSVDHDVHEASALDGASWWPKLRYVIFPYLKGPVALACVIATLNHINNFALPFVLFGVPAPDDVQTLPILTYSTSFQSFRFGLGAAMAFSSLILLAIPLIIYVRAVKLDVDEGADK
jgi:multiple sugar transport system permease protein